MHWRRNSVNWEEDRNGLKYPQNPSTVTKTVTTLELVDTQFSNGRSWSPQVMSQHVITLENREAYFYWHCLVKKAFMIVTNGSADMRPTEAYFFPDPDEDERFPTIWPFSPFPRLDRLGKMSSSPVLHALRVKLNDDLNRPTLQANRRVSFDVVVAPEGTLDGWQDGIVYGSPDDMWSGPLTWQTPLWEKCRLTIPPSLSMRKGVMAVMEGKAVPPRDIRARISTGGLWLFLSMMNRYWDGQNENDEVRALEVRNAGIAGKHSKQSIHLQSSKAGLRRLNVTQLEKEVHRIKKLAHRFLKNNEAAQFEAETTESRAVSFAKPDGIVGVLGKNRPKSEVRNMFVKKAKLLGIELLEKIIEAAESPEIKNEAALLRDKELQELRPRTRTGRPTSRPK